LNYFRGEVIS